MADLPDMIDTKEAGKLLHVTPGIVRIMLESGALAGVKVGRTWRIERAEVARRLAEHVPQGYHRRQEAQTVELAGGRKLKLRMPDADEG